MYVVYKYVYKKSKKYVTMQKIYNNNILNIITEIFNTTVSLDLQKQTNKNSMKFRTVGKVKHMIIGYLIKKNEHNKNNKNIHNVILNKGNNKNEN